MSAGTDIYVVGMASVYAGAGNLKEFWETVLTRRRGFREFPRQRLDLSEYGAASRDERDKTYATRAALIDGFEFDWKAHRVPKAAYEATDPVHWLALTTAIQAIAEGGIDLDAVGRERIGVILGNSLTGEVSRANLLRLRWPYVRQAIAEGAAQTGMQASVLADLLGHIEQNFKRNFPVPNEDTLAGALANVIAGRICNVLNLNGGGYIVDGACASSLLAVNAACEALESGRLDMVLAGGVDISLDPLEMVGFARTGALATGAMRVYDKNASGFLPGEGCGILALMRGAEVERHGLKPWARIAGWGVSSDGAGGITAPKASGQALAMRRCYARAGFGADTLDFIEGHGTGTSVGDRQELLGFLEATGGSAPGELRRIGVTSVKTLIGHAKAAAGAAGLIKAVLAANQRVLPPMAGLQTAAEAFSAQGANIYPLAQGRRLPPDAGLRAGVSGAGFGGINCHIAISSEGLPMRGLETREPAKLLASAQDAELFIASADDSEGLLARLDALLRLSAGMAEGELVDLAAAAALADPAAPMRAAVVAETVEALRERLHALVKALTEAEGKIPLAPPGTWLGQAQPGLRVGYLIPGQGSQFLGMGCVLPQRAAWAAERMAQWDAQFSSLGPQGLSGFIDLPLERAATPEVAARWEAALRDTQVAQPAIVMTSLQWMQWLQRVGIQPSAVAGHSLGEIAALVAAGLLSEAEAIELVRVRAKACADENAPQGGMLALKCAARVAQAMVTATAGYAVIANDNAPDQVVVAGEPQALAAIAAWARGQGIEAIELKVSKAFHSSHMAAAAETLGQIARSLGAARAARLPFYSCVHGDLAPDRFDPFAYLAEQISAPVRFREALEKLAAACDILVEIGPGAVLTGLARRTLGNGMAVCALEPGPGDNSAQLCQTVGQLFVAGAELDWDAFYADRYWRPFVPASERQFIENPCARKGASLAPALLEESSHYESRAAFIADTAVAEISAEASIEDIIRGLVAVETGYDLDMISLDARLARDLNLDSIKIAEVRAELRVRHIELPEDLAMGATPIRDIARVAVRRQAPLDATHERGADARPWAVSETMPKDLPVLGFVHAWRDTEFPLAGPALGSAVILCAETRLEEAQRLAKQLAEAGTRAWIDDGSAEPAKGQIERLIALPGERLPVARVSAFFARLGAWIGAGAGSAVIATRQDLVPIFGFAQSLSLEQPGLPILAVEAEGAADIAPLALAQIEPGARLLRMDAHQACRRMALDVWEPQAPPCIPLQAGDVVVVSGGAKGITAECVFALLQATHARALLLGTSPETAPGAEVEGCLQRLADAGLEALYLQCDATDEDSVRAALRRGAEALGTAAVAGLIHGAGINLPALAARLDPAALRREYAIKVDGLNHLLRTIGAERLKLCVALGSVIGAVGMPGNSGYALANEAMAAVLADIQRAHPQMRVACPAYSVWAEVGMGAKLNVLESLERQNIASIPIDEGVRWFLEACGQPDAPLPLVVAAPMHGLPTWRQARGTDFASGLPYVDARIVHEPKKLLVSRPSLNPDKMAWMADHAFRGALLLPTVQALSAIGAGARLLAGSGVVTRFTGLAIARPLIAAQQGDTPIELDVRHAQTGGWNGRVGIPGAAWADPAFAVGCWLGEPERGAVIPDSAALHAGYRAVPAEVGAHLYDALLFQGRRFQRIEALLALDLADAVRRRGRFRLRREHSEPDAPLPDIFFLDALLQSVQALIPRDMCLPVAIAEMVFYAAAWEAGAAIVEAEISEKTANGYLTQVRAWNADDGALVACYAGYQVSIVETHLERPDAHAFFEPLACDQAALASWLEEHSDVAGLSIALGAVDESSLEARRASAAAQLGGAALAWTAEGAPLLAGHPGQGVSIAHDAGRLLTARGAGRIGCDLQRVGRAARPWGELLPASRARLWRALTGAMNDRDQAGAIVWAIQEALFKAGAADAGVAFVGLEEGGAPRFRLADGGMIAAGVLNLALAGPSAIALAQLPGKAESKRVSHYTRAIEMTFKEALPPLKTPTASIFFAWMGELREEAMSDIRPALAHVFSEGGKGMVTNGTRVRIVRPVPFSAPLRAWVWLERVLASQPATFELGFQWAETSPDGAPLRIVAQGLQRLTWVDVDAGGHASVAPFPDFFAQFIAQRLPPPNAGPFVPPLGHLPERQGEEASLWRRDAQSASEHGIARLWLETDEWHSNFVGNIYFSHAAALVERACQKALRHLGTCPGGFFATVFQLDHLGEAMPGDTLEAEVRLAEVGDRFCVFDLALMNRSHGGVKIATGHARYCLFAAAAADSKPQPMPEWLIANSVEETL
jgi:enediyne polyketide synthase